MKVEVEEKSSKMEQIKSFVRDNWSTIISGSICIVASGLIWYKIGYKKGSRDTWNGLLNEIVRRSNSGGFALTASDGFQAIFSAKEITNN